MVAALFIRHPNESLKNPITGLDAGSSALGSRLNIYKQFHEQTTWQPKFSKISSTFRAEINPKNDDNFIEFSRQSELDRLKSYSPSFDQVTDAPDLGISLTKQERRMIAVTTCAGGHEGSLVAPNSLPIPFRSAGNDDLLSPQSVWALCQLTRKIEQHRIYQSVCRRQSDIGKKTDNGDDEGEHFGETSPCCPVIAIPTFVQMAFRNQDPCEYFSKVSLSQVENLRSDIFFCQRTESDHRFQNETFPFCSQFRKQISSFMMFLADKQFLKETRSLSFSNIWLPLKDESESHEDNDQHDLEMVEKLVEELKVNNVSSKFQLLFQLPANPNVVNTQRRRQLSELPDQFSESPVNIVTVATSLGAGCIFLIIMFNCSLIRLIGIVFAFFCIFACGYFSMFVAQNHQPMFVGILLPGIYALLNLVDSFLLFKSSFASALAATRYDVRTFQLTLQAAVRLFFKPFAHLQILQTTFLFICLGFIASDITVALQICHFIAALGAITFVVLITWLPASSSLSFRNKQSIRIPVSDTGREPEKLCVQMCEVKWKKATKFISNCAVPVFDRMVSMISYMINRINIIFCFFPAAIIASSMAIILIVGIEFEYKENDAPLVNLFSKPPKEEVINPAAMLGLQKQTLFPYENDVAKMNLLKETNRTDSDPFFDCNNQFQRISFVFRSGEQNLKDDILFSPETQLWFRRFCNESRYWLQSGAAVSNLIGRNQIQVHGLRECAIERLIPYFQQRQCAAVRDLTGAEVEPDKSPCCQSFKFPWQPAVYKQCLRQYVIDQILKNGAEPGIDVRFANDGSVEAGFAVEYDVIFPLYNSQARNRSKGSEGPQSVSCALMKQMYVETVKWFDQQLLSAPYQLRQSASVFVVSQQLTGSNLRDSASKVLFFSLLTCLAMSVVGSATASLNVIHSIFSIVSILSGSMVSFHFT